MDVADLGHQHGGRDQLEAPHRHERLDGWIVAPLRYLGGQQIIEPLDPFDALVQREQILFHDRLVRGQGQAQLAKVALVLLTPVSLAAVAVTRPQQERFEPLLGPGQIIDRIRTGASQVADRLVDFVGHIDRGQLARAQQPRNQLGVAPVSLLPLTARHGHLRGGHNDAVDFHFPQLPVKHEPGRAGLVGEVQFGSIGAKFGQRTFHRVPVGTDGSVGAHFSIPALIGHGNHDRILVDIEAHEPYRLFHVLVSFVGGFG